MKRWSIAGKTMEIFILCRASKFALVLAEILGENTPHKKSADPKPW
jgi:hypothetical protein